MEINTHNAASRAWKYLCLFFGFLISLYGLSAYFNRGIFEQNRHPEPSIETSTANFRGYEYLVVFIAGTWSHSYRTASIKTDGDKLVVYFKRKGSLFPSMPIGKITTIFDTTYDLKSGLDWNQVFAFKITDNIDVVVDASTGTVLWQRVSANADE